MLQVLNDGRKWRQTSDVTILFLVVCQIDCVSAHALLAISRYPRGPASGRVWRFRLAPHTPSGAKVLRAGPAVIAGRAYDVMKHWINQWWCLRCCPGAVPPSLHLIIFVPRSGRTTPLAVFVGRARVTSLPNACPFEKIVACLLRCGHRGLPLFLRLGRRLTLLARARVLCAACGVDPPRLDDVPHWRCRGI